MKSRVCFVGKEKKKKEVQDLLHKLTVCLLQYLLDAAAHVGGEWL